MLEPAIFPSHERTDPMRPDDLYASRPPWDIGHPQAAFLGIAREGLIQGRVLDVGCGTGEHALLAARLNLDATGIDLAESALQAARHKARERGLTVRFLHHDALHLADLGETFNTVLDCGLFNQLNDPDRVAFLTSLRSAMPLGGQYYMLCISSRQPGDLGNRPRKITLTELTASFTEGWRIGSIEPAKIQTTGPEAVRGWLVFATTTRGNR